MESGATCPTQSDVVCPFTRSYFSVFCLLGFGDKKCSKALRSRSVRTVFLSNFK
jgi:hypothetical protein